MLHSLQSTHVWKRLVVKYKHIKIKPIYFVFDLDGECKFIKTEKF